MKQNLILGAWVLLLVSALLAGGMGARLLAREQERFVAIALDAIEQRARTVAESIDVAVADAEFALSGKLLELYPDVQPMSLDAWKRENPLIRNVFIWERARGFILPDPAQPMSDEEASFLRRFEGLFAGGILWDASQEKAAEADAPLRSYASRRKELRELALQSPATPVASGEARKEIADELSSGWLPWYAEDRVGLLGWVEVPDRGVRYGIELEMMALLSRLLPMLPDPPPVGQVFSVTDGSGRVLHQTGANAAQGLDTLASIPVGTRLPHWAVTVYGDQQILEEQSAGVAHLMPYLLLATFVAAILFGGSLLLWQAHRNILDARRKTSFVSNVSHELKTPLTTIRMYAELLREGAIFEEEKQDRYLEVITGEARRLTRLVNNALDFGRLEQGRKEYSLQNLELGEVLEGVLDAQALRLEEAGMVLEKNIPLGMGVHSDRDALEQTFLNLVDNAVKYGAEGGVLRVETREGEGGFRVSFIDRGPGVPREQRGKIFEKFFRGDDSLTTRQPGSGLGLSIARQLMRDLGGEVACTDRAGTGACFEVFVPRQGKGHT